MPSQDSASPHALSYTTVSRQALVNEGQQPRYPSTIQPSEGRNDGPTSQSSSSVPRIGPSQMDILLSGLGLFRTESAGRHILPISTDHQRSQSSPWSKFIEITNPIIQVLGFVFATLFGAWAIKSYYISTEALKQSSLANQLAILSFCQDDQSESPECSVVLEKGLSSVINAIIPFPATLLGTAPVITATPDLPSLLPITPTLPPPPFFTTPISILPPPSTTSSVSTLSVPSFTSSILPPPVVTQVVNHRINWDIPRPFNSDIGINAIMPFPAPLLGTAPVITATPDLPSQLPITPTLPPPPFFTTPISILPPPPTTSSVPTLSVPFTSSSPTTTPVLTLPVPFFTTSTSILPQPSFTSSIPPPPVALPILPPPFTTSSVSTLSVPSFNFSILPPPFVTLVVNQCINWDIPRPFNLDIPQFFNWYIPQPSQPFNWDIPRSILPSPLITAPLVSLGLVGLIAIIICLDFVRRKSARDVSKDVKASAGLKWDAVEGSSTTHSKHLKIRSSQTFLRNRSSKHAK